VRYEILDLTLLLKFINMKFSTPYDRDDSDARCTEPCDPVSMTIPDMSYSIKDLLERFTAGTLPPVARDVSYSDSDNLDFDDFDPTKDVNFDLSDYTLFSINNAAAIVAAKEAAAKEAADLLLAQKLAIEKELEIRKNESTKPDGV
jgi:hypothetical protein